MKRLVLLMIIISGLLITSFAQVPNYIPSEIYNETSSPNKSVLITGTNDMILKLGNKTSGIYTVSFDYFVPVGYGGYYNFQHFEAPGSEWAFEIYFDNNGTGYMNADGVNAATFTFTNGQWISILHVINLDADWAQVYFDGVLIHEWQYSTQALGNAGTNQLGSVSLWAGASSGMISKYYLDNVEYAAISGELIYFDDFESYTVGAHLAQSNTVNWTTWSNAPGSSEDAVISNDVASVFAITTSAVPSYAGTTSGGGSFQDGTQITVAATPNSDWSFINWTENGTIVSTSANYTFIVSGNRNLVANFRSNQTAALLLSENFYYPLGSLLTDNGWVTHSGAGTQPIDVTQGLEFPGYIGSGIGGAANLNNTGEDVHKSFETQTTGDVYAAFVVKTEAANFAGYFFFFGIDPWSTTYFTRVWVNATGDGIGIGTSVDAYAPITVGEPTLVVAKFNMETKVSSLYVFNTFPTEEPATPFSSFTETSTAIVNVGGVGLRQFNAAQRVIVDGIRIATTWAEAVKGIEITPFPVITVSPESLTETIGMGTSSNRTLTIGNLGTPTLEYSIDLQYASKGLIPPEKTPENEYELRTRLNDSITPEQADHSLSGELEENTLKAGTATLESWLSATPITGTIRSGETMNIDLSFDATGLAIGTYLCSLVITSNDMVTPIITVPITLVVSPLYLEVSPTQQNVSAIAGSVNFSVNSNDEWTVYEDVSWLWVDPVSGSFNGDFMVSFDANPLITPRNAEITVIAGSGLISIITLYQEGCPPQLSVSPSFINMNALAGTTSFNVYSNTSWTVSTNESWISLDQTSGNLDGNFSVQYTANESDAFRHGEIIVATEGGTLSQTVYINQACASCYPAPRQVSGSALGLNAALSWQSPNFGGGGGTTVDFVEDFEAGVPPIGWIAYDIDEGATLRQWEISTAQNHTTAGANSVFHNYGPSNQTEDGWLVTPKIPIPVGVNSELRFWNYNTFPTYYGKNSVLISTVNGNPTTGNFTEVWTIASVANPVSWVEEVVDLTAYAGQEIYVAFRYQGSDAHVWYLDDVLIHEALSSQALVIPTEALQDFQDSGKGTPAQGLPFLIEGASGGGTETLNLLGYNIYRGGSLIGNTVAGVRAYTDTNLEPGTYTYGVSAVYGDPFPGESDIITTEVVVIPLYLEVNPTQQTFSALAGSVNFSVNSNDEWTVTEDVSWLSVNPISGSFNGTITVSVEANPLAATRNAEITVNSASGLTSTITLNQEGVPPQLTVSPSFINRNAVAGTTTFNVNSNTNWTVNTNETWISLDQTSGNLNGSFSVQYTANETDTYRHGEISITTEGGTLSKTVYFNQACATCYPAPRQLSGSALGLNAALSWQSPDYSGGNTRTEIHLNDFKVDIQPTAKNILQNENEDDLISTVSYTTDDLAELTAPTNQALITPTGIKHMSGDSRGALLYDNGPFINSPDTGPDGTDQSILQNTSLGMNTLGAGIQYASGNRMSDDFVVDATWNVESITVYAYQTGAPTTSTMTGAYMQIWDGDPTADGQIIWGDMTTNVMASTAWTNAYRLSETAPGTTRAIMALVCTTQGLVLEPGTYWVDYSLTGSLASGPWAPPITINGQAVTGNAKKFLGTTSEWVDFLDTGTNTPAQGLPFLIEGTSGNGTGNFNLLGYNVYRAGALIGNTIAGMRRYTDTNLEPGTFSYGISAVYGDPYAGESDIITTEVVVIPYELSVSPTSYTVGSESGAVTFEVSSNGPWTVLESADWLICEPISGSTNGTFAVNYLANETAFIRTAEIRVVAAGGFPIVELTVTQDQGAPCQASWQPIPNLQYNLQVVAQILMDGQVSLNPNDVLGAFVGEECRGIASPQPDANGLIFLTVGSDVASGEQVELRIWNSTDCSECNAIPGFEFVNQAEVGTFLEPYQVRCGAILDLSFGQGYTWFSLNVNPGTMSPASLFTGLTPCYDDRVIGQTSFALYTGSSWIGSLTNLGLDKMYRMKLCSAQNLSLMGEAAALNPINLAAGFTWLGYQPQECQSVSAAMAGLSPGPSYNDRVIGQSSFALYTGTSWIGSLTQLCPGKGYIVKLANAQSLTYPAGTSKGSPVVEEVTISPTGVYPVENMQHTMMVMAQLRLSDGSISLNEKDVVYAMIDGEVRAIGHPMVGADGIIFLSIAENTEHLKPITFMVWLDEQQELLPLNETLSFEPLAAIGNLDNPFILTLGEMVGVNEMTDGIWIGEPYPNPFGQQTTIPYFLNEAAELSYSIFDSRGVQVRPKQSVTAVKGHHQFSIENVGLARGLYMLEIELEKTTGNYKVMMKLIVQ